MLKRSFIPTYGQALAELRAMSDRSDTSEAEVITTPKALKAAKKRNAAIRKNGNPDDGRFNYNQFVQNSNYLKTEMEAGENEEILILPHQEQISPFPDKTQTHQSQQQQGQQHQEIQEEEWHLQSTQYIHTEKQPKEQNQEENHTPGQVIVVDNDGELHLYPATTEPSVAMESATTEINSGVLMSIVESIARLENKIEFLIAQNGQQNNSTDKTKDAFKLQSFKLIDSIEELSEFEKKIEGKEYIDELCPKFYCVCGPGNGLTGDNISYKYVDALFTRRLFTLVSWSGNSRIKKNESFSSFTSTFKFFFHLVQRCDSSYTEANLKKNFLKIINNSKRRYEVTLPDNTIKRMSSVKHFGNIRRRQVLKSNDVPIEPDPIQIEVDKDGEESSLTPSGTGTDEEVETEYSSDTLI